MLDEARTETGVSKERCEMKKKVLVCLVSFLCFFGQALGRKVKNSDDYAVVLAGGNGMRLWPFSRENYPKQFLSVCGDQTLIQQAVDRVSSVVKKENIWIGTTAKHKESVIEQVGQQIGRIVIEPGMRNTGPAILLSCFEIYKKDPEAVIVFLPSDPFIPNKDRFISFLDRAIDYVRKNERICLLGLKPQYPATGYGYIEYDDSAQPLEGAPFQVKRFHEKPVLDVALRYCQQENMLWNISMFCGKAKVFMQEFQKEAPDIFQGVKAFVEGEGKYEDIRAESIDFAVMEKSKKISVLPADFEWCDVGNIEVFLALQQQWGISDTHTMSVNANNNMVCAPKKFVALVGVENLCVVETDDVLLITKQGEAEKVKRLVRKLKKTDYDQYV